MNLGKYPVLGTAISAVDYSYCVNTILEAAQNQRSLAATALAVHGVMIGVMDRTFRRRLNRIDLVVPDGQPVRWALRWLHGIDLSDRVYGPELTRRVISVASEQQVPLYFYGSTEKTVHLLVERISENFPKVLIAGAEPSKFRRISPEERLQIVNRIKVSGARIVFVGLGCPRQEIWIYEHLNLLNLPMIAVGAAFDFHARLMPQAPRWMQDSGLEWFYRLLHEPRRLWKRYLLLNPLYLLLVCLQKFSLIRVASLVPDGSEKQELFG